MSDGPYRSLPMRKAWKDVSEFAHKDSYSPGERAESMCVALRNDVLRDAGRDYINALGSVLVDQQQSNLLAGQAQVEIDNICARFSQSPLRDNISGHIQAALYSGLQGEAALVSGLNNAIHDHALGCIRQVEEHYKRDAQTDRERQKTVSVRANLMQTLSDSAIENLGAEFLGLTRGEKIQTQLLKAKSIDDGPVIQE